MQSIKFGYAGKWSPDYGQVQQAAHLVKSGPASVGVEAMPATPYNPTPLYRVATNQEYTQAAQGGRVVWTALA